MKKLFMILLLTWVPFATQAQTNTIDSTDMRSISRTFIDAGHQMGKFTTFQIASLGVAFCGAVVLTDPKARNTSIGAFMLIGAGAIHLISYSFMTSAGTSLSVEGARLQLKYKF